MRIACIDFQTNSQLKLHSNRQLFYFKHSFNVKFILFKRKTYLDANIDYRQVETIFDHNKRKCSYARSNRQRSRYKQDDERWSIQCAHSIYSQKTQRDSNDDKVEACEFFYETSKSNASSIFEFKLVRHLTHSISLYKEDLFLTIDYAKKIKKRIMSLLCWIEIVERKESSNKEISSFIMIRSHFESVIELTITTYWCLTLRLKT